MPTYATNFRDGRVEELSAGGLLETPTSYMLLRPYRHGREWEQDVVAVYLKSDLREGPRAVDEISTRHTAANTPRRFNSLSGRSSLEAEPLLAHLSGIRRAVGRNISLLGMGPLAPLSRTWRLIPSTWVWLSRRATARRRGPKWRMSQQRRVKSESTPPTPALRLGLSRHGPTGRPGSGNAAIAVAYMPSCACISPRKTRATSPSPTTSRHRRQQRGTFKPSPIDEPLGAATRRPTRHRVGRRLLRAT